MTTEIDRDRLLDEAYRIIDAATRLRPKYDQFLACDEHDARSLSAAVRLVLEVALELALDHARRAAPSPTEPLQERV